MSAEGRISSFHAVHLVSIAVVGAGSVLVAVITAPMPTPGRLVLVIAVATILSWALALTAEWRVGVVAVAALWLAGAVAWTDIVGAASDDLILLLVAAFVIAYVVERSGLLATVAARILSSPMTFSALCWRLASVVGLTAFFIPSTSARAAMMLPLHRTVLKSVRHGAQRRALSVLVPTVILLSAGGVLTGAAAHILALDLIGAFKGSRITYGQWLVIAAPVAILSSSAAIWLILRLIVGRAESADPVIRVDRVRTPLTRRDFAMLAMIGATVLLWMTSGLHGASLAVVGAGAAVLMVAIDHTREPIQVTALIKAVDMKILALLISTILLAKALMASGGLAPLIALFEHLALGTSDIGLELAVAMVAAIAMLAHLVIPSRSARAAVLLPSLALPMAGVGADIAVISLVIVLGTGFCQLVPYGAKPLMIFAGESEAAHFRTDLRRVGLPLALATWAILVACALILWPLLGIFDTGPRE